MNEHADCMKNPTSSSPADERPPGRSDDNGGVSLDALLGGRVRLLQPRQGLRAAIDPVLLAASIPALAGEHVLEVGCGSGAAALCLAARVADVHIVGLDVQADLIALASESAELNDRADRLSFVAGDLLVPPAAVTDAPFDHVMANPPFARAGQGRVSPDPARALASVEGEAKLAAWVAFCAGCMKDSGTITFIHRADRAAEVATAFADAGLAATILPLGTRRVLVRGNKTGHGTVTYLSVLDLHETDGAFTPLAEAILRNAHPLVI